MTAREQGSGSRSRHVDVRQRMIAHTRRRILRRTSRVRALVRRTRGAGRLTLDGGDGGPGGEAAVGDARPAAGDACREAREGHGAATCGCGDACDEAEAAAAGACGAGAWVQAAAAAASCAAPEADPCGVAPPPRVRSCAAAVGHSVLGRGAASDREADRDWEGRRLQRPTGHRPPPSPLLSLSSPCATTSSPSSSCSRLSNPL